MKEVEKIEKNFETVLSEISNLRQDIKEVKGFIEDFPVKVSKVKIKVINGNEKEMSLEDILREIWEATRSRRDYLLIKKVFKRYPNLYGIIIVIFTKIIPLLILILVLAGFLGVDLNLIISFLKSLK